MTLALRQRALPATALLVIVLGSSFRAWGALPKVPDGFEVRLVATVPAVHYPCQVATAPDGSLFVAEDPMDQIGPYESFKGRILRFVDDKDPVVFADGFRAVQGMAWHEGSLYVSHMPFLTVLTDRDRDGKAELRRDLFKDLGPTDNKGLNDHIVSGLQFGIDGYLYISVGDKGVPKATGPDGRTIQIVGGGICRCRPDGTGLEVVSTGTRNHLEPNLDDRDNLFTYDNTDDGLGWWTRVTHQIDGGYYGYPYDYHDRPDRHLPRMAEYGGGSPCGALLYKEDAWPEKYRGIALWAEWGKGKVQGFRFTPKGASFEVAEVIDFVLPDTLENFRPIDLALSYDGRILYVADWGMGGWGSKTEKVGRVFAIQPRERVKTTRRGLDGDPIPVQIAALAHPSFNERMGAQAALIRAGRVALGPVATALADPRNSPVARRHLAWALDGIAGGTPEATGPLTALLTADVPDLRAQAARALGERAMASAAAALIPLLADPEPTVQLQAAIALGRIKDPRAIPALLPLLASDDPFLAFSARVAIRRIGDWRGAAGGLSATDPRVRDGVLAAMELVYDPTASRALAAYASDRSRPADERARALLYLSQGYRKAQPWDGKWWGTRPADGKAPAKVVDWEETAAILKTVRERLDDPDSPVRLAAVAAVKVTRDPAAGAPLRGKFASEPDEGVRVAIAQALGALDDKAALPGLIAAVRAPGTPGPVREAALASVETIGSDLAITSLVALLERGDLPQDRQPRVIAALGRLKAKSAVAPLIASLRSPAPAVRSAAAEALGKIGQLEGVDRPLRILLEDKATEVRKAAILALGSLGDREAIPALLASANRDDTRFESILALARMPDVLALQVYLAGLTDKSPDIRKASATALTKIREQAAPILDQLASRRELPPRALPELHKIYGSSKPIADWRLLGPFKIDSPPPFAVEKPINDTETFTGSQGLPVVWKATKPVDDQGQVDLNRDYPHLDELAVFGYAEVVSDSDRKVEVAVGSDDTLTVWVNGKQAYDFKYRRGFEAGKDRFEATLVKGVNRFLIKCGNHGGGWQFAVAVAMSPPHAFLKAPAAGGFDPDAFREFALKEKGKSEHGKALFLDLKGLACVKCHAVGGQGGNVGPELSSVGAKYPRDVLITSVLFPSAQVASGYEPVVVATADGRVVTGIVKADTPEALEIEDVDAKRIRIPKDQVDDRKRSDVSLMPNGLAEGLSKQDFADLIAYLETLKQVPAAAGTPAAAKP